MNMAEVNPYREGFRGNGDTELDAIQIPGDDAMMECLDIGLYGEDPALQAAISASLASPRRGSYLPQEAIRTAILASHHVWRIPEDGVRRTRMSEFIGLTAEDVKFVNSAACSKPPTQPPPVRAEAWTTKTSVVTVQRLASFLALFSDDGLWAEKLWRRIRWKIAGSHPGPGESVCVHVTAVMGMDMFRSWRSWLQCQRSTQRRAGRRRINARLELWLAGVLGVHEKAGILDEYGYDILRTPILVFSDLQLALVSANGTHPSTSVRNSRMSGRAGGMVVPVSAGETPPSATVGNATVGNPRPGGDGSDGGMTAQTTGYNNGDVLAAGHQEGGEGTRRASSPSPVGQTAHTDSGGNDSPSDVDNVVMGLPEVVITVTVQVANINDTDNLGSLPGMSMPRDAGGDGDQDDIVLAMIVNSFSDVVGEGGPSEVDNADGVSGYTDNHDINGERYQPPAIDDHAPHPLSETVQHGGNGGVSGPSSSTTPTPPSVVSDEQGIRSTAVSFQANDIWDDEEMDDGGESAPTGKGKGKAKRTADAISTINSTRLDNGTAGSAAGAHDLQQDEGEDGEERRKIARTDSGSSSSSTQAPSPEPLVTSVEAQQDSNVSRVEAAQAETSSLGESSTQTPALVFCHALPRSLFLHRTNLASS